MKPMIVLEFNELCPSLLEKWMCEGVLPNFKRFYESSDVYITKPDVDNAAEMEPWIQWYSIHTGLPYSKHGVFHLTDGPKARDETIWETLSKAGMRTGNMSGMNSRILQRKGSFGLPDPWCTSERSFPSELQTFQDFVQSQVQEYSNKGTATKIGDVARLGMFFARHGLSPKTAVGVARQVASEKMNGGKFAWKRAVQLDWMLFDVYKHCCAHYKPDYSTFFLNSTAHYQHAYWRCMEPEAFKHPPSAAEVEKYTDAILFGYQNMDRLIGEFFELEESTGSMLVLQSALSQQPFLRFEDIGGQNFYRPLDIESLLTKVGIRASQIQPVMTHQFMLRFDNLDATTAAADILLDFTLDDEPVFDVRVEDRSLYVGCGIVKSIDHAAVLKKRSGEREPFYDIFYRIEDTKSGCHHPDGVLWIKGGTQCIHEERTSILNWFPTVLDYYDVTDLPPGIDGESLLPQLGVPLGIKAA